MVATPIEALTQIEEGILLPPLPEPAAVGKQPIRFAEEILGPSSNLTIGKKSKKDKGRKDKEEGPPKKKVRREHPDIEEEDFEGYDFRIK
jgi:hypothetical protein